MKPQVNIGAGAIAVLAAIVLAALGWFFWGATLKNFFKKTFTEALNPISDQNLAYQGANKVVQAVTGDANATVGTKSFDVVQSVGDWWTKFFTGVPDPTWLQPNVVDYCQTLKNQGKDLGSSGACRWLQDNGRLQDVPFTGAPT